MLLERPKAITAIKSAFRIHSAVALTGPRQCGKTTLARMFAGNEPAFSFFDLERAVDRRKLVSAEQTLSQLTDLVVIDEIQRQPQLFEILRVLLDKPACPTRFLLLGSASPTLIKGASETLAGRVGLVDLSGFDLNDVPGNHWRALWQRGGFPRSYLAPDDAASALWRESFIRTFLERDIPQLGITIPAESLRRFWTMIAHYHGQVWNTAEFARAMGTSEVTARRYLDILNGACVLRVLAPWHENLKKRQVKSPKIYVRDSGLLHALLELDSFDVLSGHPKLGASFEGFAIEQLLSSLDTRSASFWATHGGAELDLLVTIAGKRYGFECKYSDAPGTTRAMRIAIDDLQLAHLWIIYPGDDAYELDETISVVPAKHIPVLARELVA
jgi:predicted AAA+ superfamily ATPase